MVASRLTPSRYQQEIYDWLRQGEGDALVDAVPGSGKTATLVEAARRLPGGRGLFLAFNRHIAEELRRRLPPSMEASTIHGMGLKALVRAGIHAPIDPQKYRKLTRAYVERTLPHGDGNKSASDVADLITPVVSLAQLTLTDAADPGALWRMAADYDLDLSAWEHTAPAVRTILACGIEVRQEAIDYRDMVWLPYALGLTPPGYDWVMVDEAQDLNAAQRELVLSARRAGGRVVVVGDRRQSMYRFAGADSRSMGRIADRTGATLLPLSISYRLPRSHARLVNTVYDTVESPPWAREGTIQTLDEAAALGMIAPGDMVLCRTNAPLVAMAYRLIRRGVPARARGRDIGVGLVALVRTLARRSGFTMARLAGALDAHVRHLEHELQSASGGRGSEERIAMAVAAAQDRAATILAIAQEARPHDAEALIAAITDIFTGDEDGRCVLLSTVHKAKGLEADRVWIIAPQTMPHPKAKTPDQIEQEDNIRYVAYSRAKEMLTFLA